MYIATMESESRSWIALGKSEHEAKEAIRRKWNATQRNLKENGWINKPALYYSVERLEEDYAINVVNINPNECVSY